MRGPNMDSDHFLQKVIILIIHRKNSYNPKKGNKANLQIPMKHREYRAQLYNRLKNITDQKEINEEWENIKIAIRESAEKTTQSQETSPKYEWWIKSVDKPLHI
jgi:hypothetical protein